MSIQIVSSYLVGDKLFASLEEAQRAELAALFEPWTKNPDEDSTTAAAAKVVEKADEVIAILSGKPRTKRVRSDKGTKRGPKAATVAS